VKYRAKDGTRKVHGPYPILTFKEKGKTRTIRLESPEQEEIVRKQIANFRLFRQWMRQLIEIGRELADVEFAEETGGKKNSSNASRSRGKRKRPRSSNA
jgi:ribosomal protein L29